MSLVLTALLAVLGVCGFPLVFAVGDLAMPVGAAVVTATGVSAAVTGRWRRGPSITAVACLAALAGVGTGLGVASGDGLVHGARLVNGTSGSVTADEVTSTVPFVVAGLAALVGAELVQRSRSAVAPVLPSAVALVVTLLVVPGDDAVPALWPSAWAAVALVLVGWRQRQALVEAAGGTGAVARPLVGDRSADGADGEGAPGRSRSPGILATAAVLAVLVATAGTLALLAGATGHRALADQRLERFPLDLGGEDPEDDPTAFNPLSRVTTLWWGPDEVLFEVDSSSAVDWWRLAVLDEYDGVNWTASQPFEPVGEDLPEMPEALRPDPSLREEPVELTQRVTVTGAGREAVGSRMPAAGQPRSVTVDGEAAVGFHPGSGTLEAGGVLPDSYQVVSDAAWPDEEALASADVASDPEARAALDLPEDVPEAVVEWAEAVVDGVEAPHDRALALATWFGGYELAFEEPPSGHSHGHLSFFLFDPAGGRGSPEQFAAAYALMARSVGLPSRVVVGFHGLGVAGDFELTSWLATAWVEIKLDGVGWVPIDPLPAPAADGFVEEGADEVAGADESLEDVDDEDEDTQDDDAAATDGDGEEDSDGAAEEGGGVPAGLLVAGGVGLLVTVFLLAPALLRRRRLRRLRQGAGPAERVAGAWTAALDVLATAGVPVTDDLGAMDVVAVVGENGPERVTGELPELASLVNRALFAPVDLDDGAARRAWKLQDDLAGRHRRSRSWRQAVGEYFRVQRRR